MLTCAARWCPDRTAPAADNRDSSHPDRESGSRGPQSPATEKASVLERQSPSYSRCIVRTARHGAEAGSHPVRPQRTPSPAFPQYTQRCDCRDHPSAQYRAAQHVRIVVRLDERRPGSAERAVAAVPAKKRRAAFSWLGSKTMLDPFIDGQSTSDVPTARYRARQSATPNRARTPCGAHSCELPSGFARAKRRAVNPRLYRWRRSRLGCGARSRRHHTRRAPCKAAGVCSFSPGGIATGSFRSAGSPRVHFSRIDVAVNVAGAMPSRPAEASNISLSSRCCRVTAGARSGEFAVISDHFAVARLHNASGCGVGTRGSIV